MSKKIWSTASWRNSQAVRHAKRAKRMRPAKSGRGSLRRVTDPSKAVFKGVEYEKIFVPEVFSLLRNPQETLAFLNSMRRFWHDGRNVFFRFDKVRELGVEAIAALTATVEFHHESCQTRGNLPKDARCREILIQSDMLSRTDYRLPVPSKKKGMMAGKTSKRVEVLVARDLVEHATERAFGTARKAPAAYRALVEGMQNTYDHADKDAKGEKKWVATVFADAEEKKASFTLLDSGVGIFKSVRMEAVRTALRALGVQENTQVLKDILHRRIPSSTGLKYRGRGLPSFLDAAKRGTLENVTIIANDVFANISQNDYRKLDEGFDGTLLYWEISE